MTVNRVYVASNMTENNPSFSSGSLPDPGYPADFIHQLQQTIIESNQPDNHGALLILSIDNLAMLLSGYGHTTTERVMQYLQHEATDIIGQDDIIQRIQRDQFGIILKNTSSSEAGYLAERLISHIQHLVYPSDYGNLHTLCTIAAVAFPDHASTLPEVLDRSYIALHAGPAPTTAIRSFDADQDHSALNRQEMGLASYLNRAIREKRLQMAYQPIISAKDGSIAHYEALLRLVGEDGSISSAGALIPIAERMGMINLIDNLTFDMVLQELRRDPHVVLAFNISNLTTHDSGWLDYFTRQIQQTPEIADRLIVEITETAAQIDLRQTAYFVAQIQALGAQVALDDFGSGYTSFLQLKSLSVDMVKIDGSFVKDLVDNSDNRFFVKTLLDFTNGFGLKSVAEFVENGEIAKMLIELGVQYLQGYYFGRPQNHRSWLDGGEYSSDVDE